MKSEQKVDLDNLFRKYIRLRDGREKSCPFCKHRYSTWRVPQVCHDVKRRFLNTRWEMTNAILGCSICNTEDKDISLFIDQRFGSQTSENNKLKSRSNTKPDYTEVKLKLNDAIQTLLSDLYSK